MNAPTPRLLFADSMNAETTDFYRGVAMEVGSVAYDQPEPPRWVIYENSTGEEDMPLTFDVVNMGELFRNAPTALVEVLFERHFITPDGVPFRVAEPCLDTGDTLFRGHTNVYCTSREAGDALDWVRNQADKYSFSVTLQCGERIAIDNRRQWVRFHDSTTIERGYVY